MTTTVNGHKPIVPILLISGSDTLADTLQPVLAETEFSLHTANQSPPSHELQAIVVDAEHLTIEQISQVRETHQSLPLLLVTETMTIDASILNCIDAMSSPDPISIIYQLRMMLRLKAQNAHLSQKVDDLEKKLITLQRASSDMELLKNAIVRNVSHELRTPLLQVKSAVAMMAEDNAESTLYSFATNAVARLEGVVRNITMLGSTLDIKPGAQILRDAIEHSRHNLARTWQHKVNIDRVDIVIEPNLPPIKADKQGLSTVLQQLIENALKFSDSDDKVEVSGRRHEDYVRVSVRDLGIGIAEEERQTIFESFYQVDSSSTRPYGGTGVGLALVKLILDLHDITIHVESKLGEGSTFWFDLPIVNLDDASQFDE